MDALNQIIEFLGSQAWFLNFLSVVLVQWMSSWFVSVKHKAKLVVVFLVAVVVTFIQMIVMKKINLADLGAMNVTGWLNLAVGVGISAIAWYKMVIEPINIKVQKATRLKEAKAGK